MQKTWVGIAPFVAAAVLAAPACKKKDDTKPAEKVVSNEKKEEPKPKIGIENPTNDPEVVAAAKQLLADCGKVMDESSGDSSKPNEKKSLSSCDKWSAFSDKQFDKKDATFVNLLEDPDVKVRAIGVSGLNMVYDWKGDKTLAGKAVDLLKKEKAPSPIDMQWAVRVASIRSSAGVDEQIKALASDPATSTDVKTGILAWWDGGEPAYQALKANATSTDPAMINAVVQGYARHFKDHSEEACAYWTANLGATHEYARKYALGHMTGGWTANTTQDSESDWYISGGGGGPNLDEDKRCSEEQLSKAVDVVEKVIADDKTDSEHIASLGFIAKDKKSPPKLKERAIKDLKALVEKKGSFGRSSALRALGDTGDPAMKAYAKKFAKDEDLKSAVEDILKKK